MVCAGGFGGVAGDFGRNFVGRLYGATVRWKYGAPGIIAESSRGPWPELRCGRMYKGGEGACNPIKLSFHA